MTDFHDLKSLPVPPANSDAKRRALAAALDAFDAVAAEEKTPVAPQGNVTPLRPTSATATEVRSTIMQSTRAHPVRPLNYGRYAMAASVATALLAVPFVLTVTSGTRPEPLADTTPASVTPKDAPKTAAVSAAGQHGAQSLATAAPEAPAELDALKVGQAKLRERLLNKAEEAASQGALSDSGSAAPKAKPKKKPATVSAKPKPVAPPPAGVVADFFDGRAAGSATGGLTLGGEGKVSSDQPAGYAVAITTEAGEAAPSGKLTITDRTVLLQEHENRDQHPTSADNPVKQVAAEPVSTFSLDVDTASYAFVRRSLMQGRLPSPEAVRVEEMVNYFPYAYPAPESRDVPFRPTVTVFQAPWNADRQIVHVGIKGYTLPQASRPRANLVFLIDVSGSMAGSDRLPLVLNSFRLLLDTLQPDDTVGIVTYAGASGIALEPTKVKDKTRILAAIGALGSGGSTAGAAGIMDAYRLAEANFDTEAVNRVILATDGDFNVGTTDEEQLKSLVEQKRKSGVFLSILGVGEGNYNDSLMQTLAQNGNGVAAYVDTLNEARKVLVEEAAASLFPIATDVKVQVEFNPAAVREYRLIGYETRILNREDFNNDAKDAGDVGSGHTVTAIYEVTPVGAKQTVDPLRYGTDPQFLDPVQPAAVASGPASELGYLKLRYKLPGESVSKLIELPLANPAAGTTLDAAAITAAPADVRFSTAVAAFGQLLRGPTWTGTFRFDDVLALAQSAKGEDPFGYRAEFISLVRLAKSAQP